MSPAPGRSHNIGQPLARDLPLPDGAAGAPVARPHAFAHASEAELARILDFYEVRWAYEPDTFPIGWNLEGEVTESFSPDFYLPELELYVELTTLRQKLVRRKNRKLRRLRELYPDVRIKLFYGRDFRMLLLKFGRIGLVQELTGTPGQATPPRVAAAIAGAPTPGATSADDPGAAVAGAAAAPATVADTPDDMGAGDPSAPVAGRSPRGRRRGRRRHQREDATVVAADAPPSEVA